ncbi:triose-phosphate isomerase [Acetomicrobium sp. S15 = DSM 107314]|uniref:triose-phosphate isomerase n=1 Tax=Acetomicrobium sp. S15 = DSM 107314 TaxID=2529858 RepID=UPI0018E1AA3B|nr:triose-phosphate isomerase [Acetomicrobium sp. S15 = DSM 107314]
MERCVLLAGNWKMHKGPKETRSFLEDLDKVLELENGITEAIVSKKIELALFPPFISIPTLCDFNHKVIKWGGQNAHWEEKGAFTGEISIPMLLELGCSYVILGHSERRHIFGETDEMVSKKVTAALDHGLSPVLCVGETLDERNGGNAFSVIRRQLLSALEGVDSTKAAQIVVAYEPVWAIGTGRTASDTDAQEACSFIRSLFAERYGQDVASGVRILYGGSVNPKNAAGLLGQPDIDGALIGGASLSVESYIEIVKEALSVL